MTRRRVALATLLFTLTGFSIGQTAFIPAVPALAERLHVSTVEATWAVTASLLSSAVATPALGRLADMFGRRRLFVILLLAIGAGSLVSALAGSLAWIVVGRVLYGLGVGVFPVGYGIVRELYPPQARGTAIGVLAALGGLGGGLGPAIGGALVSAGSPATIFWAGIAVAVVPALGVPFLPARRAQGREPIDWQGALLLAVGLALPLVAVTESRRWGWLDPQTLGLIAAGLLVLVGFVAFERRRATPLLDMKLALDGRVALANGSSFLLGGANYAPCVLVPLLAQAPVASGYGLGMSPVEAGLLLVPASAALVVTGGVGGRLRSGRKPGVALAASAAGSAVALAVIATRLGNGIEIAFWTAAVFAGVGLALGAMTNLVVDLAPPAQTSEAAAVSTVARIVGATLATQLAVAVAAAAPGGELSAAGFEHAFLIGAVASLGAAAIGMVFARGTVDRIYADD